MHSPGKKFRLALEAEFPLQILGTVNAYSALLAQKHGAQAIYLSGAGVANSSLGLPDLAITTLDDVLTDAMRITAVCDLPLLIDVDTGWGSHFNIRRMITTLIKAGAAAIHIEDQISAKRCGHRPKKILVSKEEMGNRIKSAVDARTDADFVIMARTDAFQPLGLRATIERANYYIECGADMLFAEAIADLASYRKIVSSCPVPVLANNTEFGQTPLFTLEEFKSVGVKMVLYPLSAFRAMNKAAANVYETILNQGTQKKLLNTMQTRAELYADLNYLEYEQALDRLFYNSKQT